MTEVSSEAFVRIFLTENSTNVNKNINVYFIYLYIYSYVCSRNEACHLWEFGHLWWHQLIL